MLYTKAVDNVWNIFMLLQKIVIALLVLPFLAACSSLPSGGSVSTTPNSIQTFLPGDYVGQSSRGELFHSIVRLDVPAFGGEVFYHHISTESLRGPAVQQKVYRFEEGGKLMRSTVILGSGDVLPDEKTLTEKVSALTEEQLLRFPDDCRFEWRGAADGFIAEVSRDKCSYDSPAFGGLVSPEMEYQLNRCGLAVIEGIYRQDGSPVFPPLNTNNKRVNEKLEGC